MQYELHDWGSAPNPGVYRFRFPQNGQKKQATKVARSGVKSMQPLRSHSCVAVSCRTGKANYIINNCLEDYSIYTVCATLPKVQSKFEAYKSREK